MVNRVGWSGHLCLITDFCDNASSSPLFSMILVNYCLYYVEICPLHSYILQNFCYGGMLDFCQRPFLQLMRWSYGFCPWVHLHGRFYSLIYILWNFPVSLQWRFLDCGDELLDMLLNPACKCYTEKHMRQLFLLSSWSKYEIKIIFL